MLALFEAETPPNISLVGGKAASLIRLRQAGFRIPDGFCLTTTFFKPWLALVESSPEWVSVIAMVDILGHQKPGLQTRNALADACDQAKQLAKSYTFSAEQRRALEAIGDIGPGPFAVRSSSPEEDLAGASFAGQYETVLDVAQDDIDAAVRTCFVSCLDSRVLLYKQEMRFDSMTPSIAVVVQQLVASEVSGVAFSINPLTNDYDEILINAAWGLGEALVRGDLTPDSLIVNKVTDAIIERRTGDKGGVAADEACLDDEQVRALADAVKRIENLYETPVDVEWSYAAGKLHILQARPITAYIPLAPQLLTRPDEPRHLYIDAYLTDGITMSGTISPISNDLMRLLMAYIIDWICVPIDMQRLDQYGLHLSAGRFYVDLSVYLHLVPVEVINLKAKQMDPTMAAIFSSPELDQYRLDTIPSHLSRFALYKYAPLVLWRARRAITSVLGAMLSKTKFKIQYHQRLADFEQWVRRPIDFDAPVEAQFVADIAYAGSLTLDSSYPAFVQFFTATSRLQSLIDSSDPEQVKQLYDLLGGYEDDMVVQMGHRIFDMAVSLPLEAFVDLATLEAQLRERTLPKAFLDLWDSFIHDYGHRGPLEMDLVNDRYGDSPRQLLRQIANLAKSTTKYNPHSMHTAKVDAREAAYARLQEILPARKAKKLVKLYRDAQAYTGAREYFKHHLTHVYHRVRKHVLHRAEAFITAGRLDEVSDIFQLTLAEVDRVHDDRAIDIRALVESQGALYRKQRVQVKHFPLVIDSRGRRFRPKVARTDLPAGTFAGAAVSAGVAIGPIKVLNDPFEKEVEPGDVLVAVTTDPGWTPLFINAAAVILEIGGELQHGALVAREYGKPCVSGINDVTNAFTDGQMVEVDGNTGLIRLID